MNTHEVLLFFAILATLIIMSALYFIGPARDIEYVDVPGPTEVVTDTLWRMHDPVIVRMPVPFAISDESLGAYRVNGFATFGRGTLGGMTLTATRQQMACFPVD